MPGRYAQETTVSSERSRAEIETVLRKYGAGGFLSGYDENRAFIAFKMADRQVKFFMDLPSPAEARFTHTASRGKRRSAEDVHRGWEQACRQQWRALALVIKAKLEAVAAGITIFEDEFLAHIVLPDGKTIADHVRPALVRAYDSGKVPPLLPNYSDK
jgi:hypothetical protein